MKAGDKIEVASGSPRHVNQKGTIHYVSPNGTDAIVDLDDKILGRNWFSIKQLKLISTSAVVKPGAINLIKEMKLGDKVYRTKKKGTLGWATFCNDMKLPLTTTNKFKITKIEKDHIYIDGHIQKFGKENFEVFDVNSCTEHKFKPYTGFTEVYHYCELCDAKVY